jgi:uncharacterized membrane protein YphA (DoxX/SURF4 family)
MLMAVLANLDAYAAAFLSALLIASALHKALGRERLRRSVAALGGLGDSAARFTLPAVALFEFVAGVGLILPASRAVAGLASAGLWGVYAWLIARALAAGRTDIDCGCAFGAKRDTISYEHFWRNLGLIGLALATAAGAAAPAAAPVTLSSLAAGLACLTLYAAFDQLAALRPTRR